jgi:hypothetical protein
MATDIELIFTEQPDVESDAIALLFGDSPPPVDEDWAAVTPYINQSSTSWELMAGRRNVDQTSFANGQWYRCINPDTDPPVIENSELIDEDL